MTKDHCGTLEMMNPDGSSLAVSSAEFDMDVISQAIVSVLRPSDPTETGDLSLLSGVGFGSLASACLG